jgi:hypothetical protein
MKLSLAGHRLQKPLVFVMADIAIKIAVGGAQRNFLFSKICSNPQSAVNLKSAVGVQPGGDVEG